MMTGRERIQRQLKRRPVDRVGIYEHFWPDTVKRWTTEGYLTQGESPVEHFDLDVQQAIAFDLTANQDFVPEVIEETQDTLVLRDGNGAVLRQHKHHDTTPEHVDFLVRDRSGWEEHIKPLLSVAERRISFEQYRDAKESAERGDRFCAFSFLGPYEQIRKVAGTEHSLVGMGLDPDWIVDMAKTYTDLIIGLSEILFQREGSPDGIWFPEDLGFKAKPFMSPAMYRELLAPSHRRIIDFAHSQQLPVVMHSCGYVEPLIPEFVWNGLDCLQVLEVKAGVDVLRVSDTYGDELSLMGGMDARVLESNNNVRIAEELESKLPILMQTGGYVLHSDHSISSLVAYDSYTYFLERGRELGKY